MKSVRFQVKEVVLKDRSGGTKQDFGVWKNRQSRRKEMEIDSLQRKESLNEKNEGLRERCSHSGIDCD